MIAWTIQDGELCVVRHGPPRPATPHEAAQIIMQIADSQRGAGRAP